MDTDPEYGFGSRGENECGSMLIYLDDRVNGLAQDLVGLTPFFLSINLIFPVGFLCVMMQGGMGVDLPVFPDAGGCG